MVRTGVSAAVSDGTRAAVAAAAFAGAPAAATLVAAAVSAAVALVPLRVPFPICLRYSLNSHYGSPTELQRLIRGAASEGIACCVDLVANHRCGTRQDSRGDWTIFEDPDWGSWAIVRNNLQGYHGEGGDDTGVSVDCAPDIDHTNPQVQRDMKAWTEWLMKDIGYLAFRIDMAGGYAPQYQATTSPTP